MQSGCDSVLARMKRKYDTARYYESVVLLRDFFPNCAITTDMIVAFPGETEELFEESREFVRQMDFANTHIFRYSPRPGTAAAKFPDRPSAEDSQRRSELLKLDADAASARFAQRNAGTTAPVIFEEVRDGFLYGWTDHYLQVKVPEGTFPEGKIVQVRLPDE